MKFALLMVLVAAATPTFTGAPPSTAPATAPAKDVQPVAAPTRPDEYLLQGQLVQAFQARQYQLVIRETSRILANPLVLKKYDDFNLRVLKAEARLQTKDALQAAQDFEQAAKNAPDDKRRAVMIATMLLVKRQTNLKYMSHATDAQGNLLPPVEKGVIHPPVPIDVLDLAARSAALKALFYDELFKADDLVHAAEKASSLPAIAPAVKAIEDVKPLELAATGQTKSTTALQKLLAKYAEKIIHENLDAIAIQTAQLRAKANHVVVTLPPSGVGNGIGGTGHAAGLLRAEVNSLKSMLEAINKLELATDELVQHLDLDPKTFETVLAEAAATRKQVEDVIDSVDTTIGNPP